MEDYEEIKLNVYREVICFSLFFFSFFAGNFYKTNEFFGWTKVRQRKIKIRQQYLNEYNYRLEWVKKYKWRTI